MKHLDLFSGIGGFALAAKWVWEDDYENVAFCDIEPYAQEILKLRFNNPKIYGDIRTIKGADLGTVDLVTGGFPCQPFSDAGLKGGKEDNRYLWPEMLRVIKECKPTWIIGENVAGIVNMALDDVLFDLESEGYETRTFMVPACAINAPHRRDRVWIIGYSKYNGIPGAKKAGKNSGIQSKGQEGEKLSINESQGRDSLRKKKSGRNTTTTNTSSGRCGQCISSGKKENYSCKNCEWNSRKENWPEIAAELCGMDDGIPSELDGFKLSESGHRRERLKALGNAIVPQVVYEIMKGIKFVES